MRHELAMMRRGIDDPERRTMVKLIFCLRRRPGMTREEFQRYWRDTHASLVEERAPLLGIRRYVQLHTADAAGLHEAFRDRNGGSPEPYDGVAEIWFDSLDSLTTADEAALRAGGELLADEGSFIDLPNSPMFVGAEHVVIG